MHALKRDWGHLHLAVRHGDAGAPKLVFLNSLGTDMRMWDAVCTKLPAGWSLLRMDKRGHGLSETAPEGYGIPDLAEDVIAAMDHAGFERVVLVGCSIGGLIAQHVALMQPARVEALVLSNTASVLGDAEGWLARIEVIRETGMQALADGILPRWFGPEMLAHPDAPLWRTMLARTDAEGYIATCRAIAGTDITDRLSEIAQPALVIGGQHDLATPPEVVTKLASDLPRADLIMFETTGHLPAIEAPAAFVEAVLPFIKRSAA